MRNYGGVESSSGETVLILDPSRDEEEICDGFLQFVINDSGELIYISQQGKLKIDPLILGALVQKLQNED